MNNRATSASSVVVANTPLELATKLYPPRLPKSHVARPRLDAWFGGKPSARVALVRAPAGAGKSTLAAQWLARTGSAAAWVTLEASDGRPQPFFALVLAAIRGIDPDLVPVTAALVADPRAFDTETVTQQLIAELSAASRPLTLVLDDYHNVESPNIHRAVSQLVQNLPAAMRLVIIGRDVPPLELDSLDLDGELARLGQPELSFTLSEAMGFYRQGLNVRLTEREVDGILTRTGGLAAGLQLAGVALRNRSRVRTRRSSPVVHSSPDLWETLLDGQPPEVQSFLLRTSILRQFTADSCDAVTGFGDSLDMIHRWEREGLFLEPLDDRGLWYRYHNLFADVLRARLANAVSEKELAELHRSASTWLDTHGHVEEAVYHSMAAQDWDRAVTLLEAYCSGLFDRDHIATLCVRLEGLPDEIFARSPRLAFWLAWAIGRDGRWQQGFPLLEIAQAAQTSSDHSIGQGLIELWHAARAIYDFDSPAAIALADRALNVLPPQQETARVMALMTRGMGHLFTGDTAMSVQTFADVRRTVDSSGQTWLRPFEMTYSAMASAQQGQLPVAAGMSVAAVREMGEPPVEIWAQPALRQLGDVLLEWGRLEEAQEAFSRAMMLAERSQALHWRSRVRIGLARTAWVCGNHEEAFAEIDQALDVAETIGNLQDMRSARAWQARFWLELGQLQQVRSWVDSSELDPELQPTYGRQVEYLTLARLFIRERQPVLARTILQHLADQADAAGRIGDLVGVEVLTAIAQAADGDHVGADMALNSALELGRPGGFLRVFVNEGAGLESLLRRALAQGHHREYAAQILDVLESIPASK